MKYIYLILFLLLAKPAVCQSSDEDTLKKAPFVSKLLYDNPNKKHSHILDYEWGILVNNYGYNYYYRLNPNWQVGGRVGVNFYKAHGYPYDEDLIMPLKIEGLLSYRIYRSISAEIGLGYYTDINLTSSMNGIDNLVGRGGLNVSIFRYLFLRGGMSFSYVPNSNHFHSDLFGSIGIKL